MNEFNANNHEKAPHCGYAGTINNQKGVTVILVALLLVVIMGFVGLAVDVGYYMVTRNELQNIADGAALAACRELGEIYRLMPPEAQQSYICSNPAPIVATALSVGANNKAGGLQGITIAPADVIIGDWDSESHTFTPTLVQPDAVRVIARRQEGYADGPISTYFVRVLGIDTVDVWMDATAALTGQGSSKPGELEIPVGISRYFFEGGPDAFCKDSIVFNPTNDPESCAGWNSYNISPPNDNLLRQILDGSVDSPGTTANDTDFNFIGGNLSNPTFDEMMLLFMRQGYDITEDGDPVLVDDDGKPIIGPLNHSQYPATVPIDEEGNPTTYLGEEQAYYPDDNQNPTPRNKHKWETSVVVYDWDDCSNPNTTIPIVGYSKIVITNVQTAPEKRIEGLIECDRFSNETTRGGGGEFGIKGTIPGLVE